MIYLVSKQQSLFENPAYKTLTVEKSLEMLKTWKILQYDSETDGRNPHINSLLCVQLGNPEGDIQIVIDCTTVNIKLYKELLESKYLIVANGKFDLQFLYNFNIIPRKIYDVVIAEQVLYLGFPHLPISKEEYIKYNYDFAYLEKYDKKGNYLGIMYSTALKALCKKYLNEDMDKTVRGEIIWRGLDTAVILYAAKDVQHLKSIMDKQIQKAKDVDSLGAVKLECLSVPWVAYLEWCGIKLSEERWLDKMKQDNINLEEALKALNAYCINHAKLKKFVKIDRQLDLFMDGPKEPYFNINWQKDEAKAVFKALGFNLKTISKTTKEETESVMEKVLATQKGIDDEFLKLYFTYQGYYKVTTSFGQGHLDLINPKTGRLHTTYWQIGTASGK